MRVPVENNADTCSLRNKVEICDGVQHVDEAATELDSFSGGEFGALPELVDVTANGCDGGDATKFSQDVGVADIASVQDMVDTCECWKKLRSK